MYEEGAPHAEAGLFETGIPILGICYGLQELAWVLGGEVLAGEHREYGHATIAIDASAHGGNTLFDGLGAEMKVWMSHGDKLTKLPPGFSTVAHTSTSPFAAVANADRHIYGLQFHPEVTHTPQGKQLLRNFVLNICKCHPDWTMVRVCPRAGRVRAPTHTARAWPSAGVVHRARDQAHPAGVRRARPRHRRRLGRRGLDRGGRPPGPRHRAAVR